MVLGGYLTQILVWKQNAFWDLGIVNECRRKTSPFTLSSRRAMTCICRKKAHIFGCLQFFLLKEEIWLSTRRSWQPLHNIICRLWCEKWISYFASFLTCNAGLHLLPPMWDFIIKLKKNRTVIVFHANY